MRITLVPATLLPVLLVVAILYCLDTGLRFYRWSKRRQNRRSPLSRQLLRGPGQSLREAVDELRVEMSAYIFVAVLWPVLTYAIYISLIHYDQIPETLFVATFFALLAAGVFVYGLVKILKLRRAIDTLREGLDGELAVAQELNELLRDGFWIFHDVPGDDFNVDHVVVGPTGVFAIETKARKKPITDNRRADAQVEYDGNCLRFPDWTDKTSVAQTSLQAKWVARWLRDSTGDKAIEVKPVLALPGWFVTRTANSAKKTNPVIVINPKNPRYLASQNVILSESQIQRIVYQIDGVCRDIDPYEASKDPTDSPKENGLAKKVKSGT